MITLELEELEAGGTTITLELEAVPSVDDVVPSVDDVVPSLDDVVPSLDDVVPSVDDVVSSLDDATADELVVGSGITGSETFLPLPHAAMDVVITASSTDLTSIVLAENINKTPGVVVFYWLVRPAA